MVPSSIRQNLTSNRGRPHENASGEGCTEHHVIATQDGAWLQILHWLALPDSLVQSSNVKVIPASLKVELLENSGEIL
jgi:hypothetical protein